MKVKDLIIKLLDFNPDAVIVSEISLGWSAPDGAPINDSKKNTGLVAIYSTDNLDDYEVEEV